MTFQFTPTVKDSAAPDIEPGIYDAIFDGAVLEEHEEWAGKDSYGNPDDGKRLRWSFTLVDDDGATFYDEEGEPMQVRTLTNLKMNPKAKTLSKPIRFLKAILTADEFKAFAEDNVPPDSEAIIGRPVQLDLFLKDSGWPEIANVLPPRRKAKRPVAAAAE